MQECINPERYKCALPIQIREVMGLDSFVTMIDLMQSTQSALGEEPTNDNGGSKNNRKREALSSGKNGFNRKQQLEIVSDALYGLGYDVEVVMNTDHYNGMDLTPSTAGLAVSGGNGELFLDIENGTVFIEGSEPRQPGKFFQPIIDTLELDDVLLT